MMLRADLAQQDLELGTRCTGQVCRTPGGMVAHTAAIEVVAPLRPQENTVPAQQLGTGGICTLLVPLTPVGLEPTIPGSLGRCLIHWATGPAKLFCQVAVRICQVNARAALSCELIRAHELGH